MTGWPTGQMPPRGDRYDTAAWLLGRHPRLARLAERVTGLVHHAADGPWIDLDHLAEVLNAEPRYHDSWVEYRRHHREPSDDAEWDTWRTAGPQADEYCVGLDDFLVMSTGERALLRLLGTLAADHVPFSTIDLRSLDIDGRATVADWAQTLTSP